MPCDDATWCGYTAFCDAPDGTCPSPTNLGVCKPLPHCDASPADQVTCGCNGQVYVSACQAQASYGDYGPQGGCVAPRSPFACASALCETGVEFCTTTNGYPRCEAIPPECASPATTCDCLQPYFCFSAPVNPQCGQDDHGNFVVTCEITE